MMVELEDVGIIIIEGNGIKIVVRKRGGTSGAIYSWDVFKNGGVDIHGAGSVGRTDEEVMDFLRKNYNNKDSYQW